MLGKDQTYDPIRNMDREKMRKLIIDNRGDIYRMAEWIRVSPRRVRRAVAADEEMQALQLAAAKAVSERPELKRVALDSFREYMEDYTRDLALVGLQQLETLATMDRTTKTHVRKVTVKDEEGNNTEDLVAKTFEVGLSAADLKVKYEAARTLASMHQPAISGGSEEGGDILQQLDRLYKENAPRIKEIRQVQTVVTLEAPREEAVRVVDQPQGEPVERLE